MNNYYHILGVTPNATLEQIKKAYREKAKLYHPDVNKAADAHDHFILVNEAYEYLLNTTGNNTNRIKRNREKSQKQAAYQQQWEQEERQKVRDRAREYARMKYEAYLKSDVYRTTEAINVVVDFFVTLLLLAIVVLLPILSYREMGSGALFLWAIIIIPTFPLWFRFIVRGLGNIDFQSFFVKTKSTFRSRIINIILLFAVNLFIFFQMALNTLLPINWILGVYGSSFILGFALAPLVKRNYHKYMLRFNITPGLVSLFFLLNYVFSTNPISETYWYTYRSYNSTLFSTIELEDNAYQAFKGIRIFVIEDNVKENSRISYEFQDGLFGLRVAKHIYIYAPIHLHKIEDASCI